jgi:hypothetical protein
MCQWQNAARRTVPSDDLPADAMIDSVRRKNWEVQHSVTMDSMYNKFTTGAWQEINNKPW